MNDERDRPPSQAPVPSGFSFTGGGGAGQKTRSPVSPDEAGGRYLLQQGSQAVGQQSPHRRRALSRSHRLMRHRFWHSHLQQQLQGLQHLASQGGGHSATCTQRGFLTQTSLHTWTGTFLQTLVGTISVTW